MSIPTFGDGRPAPSPEEIDWQHQRAGRGRDRVHHFLGLDADDASPGNHTHDGKNSLRISVNDIDGLAGEQDSLIAAFSRANRVRNPDFRVNQRGYVSGAALPPQQYGPDRWCASGLANRNPNPSAETNTTGWYSGACTFTRSNAWASSGSWSFSCAATGADSFISLAENNNPLGLTPGKVYTAIATARLSAALTGATVAGRERRIWFYDGTVAAYSAQAANVAGETRVAVAFTVPTTGNHYLRFYNGHASGTIWWDDVMVIEGDWTANLPDYFDGSVAGCMWTGTAHASTSYNVAAVGNYFFGYNSSSYYLTIPAGMSIFQAIEGEDVTAGAWLLSWTDDVTGRVYKASTPVASRPAFAASPVPFTSDGSSDPVIVEFQAGGSTGTLRKPQLIPGTVAQPYVPRLLSEELAICQRYYVRHTASISGERLAYGLQPATTVGECVFFLPVDLRAKPIVGISSMWWTDGVAFNAAITGQYGPALYSGWSGNRASVGVAFGAAGAARYPGAMSAQAVGSYVDFDSEMRVFAA